MVRQGKKKPPGNQAKDTSRAVFSQATSLTTPARRTGEKRKKKKEKKETVKDKKESLDGATLSWLFAAGIGLLQPPTKRICRRKATQGTKGTRDSRLADSTAARWMGSGCPLPGLLHLLHPQSRPRRNNLLLQTQQTPDSPRNGLALLPHSTVEVTRPAIRVESAR